MGVSGIITGTPDTAGSVDFTVRIDKDGCFDTIQYIFDVDCPTITVSPAAASLPNGQVLVPYSQLITASGSPLDNGPYIYSLSGTLPPGLSFDGATGILAGTPTNHNSGTAYSFSITATDTYGCTGTENYSMTIACPSGSDINPTTAALPGGTAGSLYFQSVQAVPIGTAYVYTVSVGSLPAGLTLDASTGIITGTPTTGSATASSFTIQATGWGGCTTTRAYTLAIACPTITLTPPPIASATASVPYNEVISATPLGTTYTYTHTGGTIPPGLTINSNGVISGTPTDSNGGTAYSFQITATGWGSECTGTETYFIDVACPTITLTSGPLPNGTASAAYTSTVTAAPAGTYAYAVTIGSLPPGLALNSGTGEIAGIPYDISNNPYVFTITATGWGGCTGSQAYSITIDCPTITLSPNPLDPIASFSYSQLVAASPPVVTPSPTAPPIGYTYAITSGALPPGLSMDSTGLITGIPYDISGNPYTFDITATGWGGCSGTQSYSLNVQCPTPYTFSANPPDPTAGVAYSQAVSVTAPLVVPPSPAAPPIGYTYAITAGALPPGLSMDSAGNITGVPYDISGNTYSFDVTASGWGGCTDTQNYTLNVQCPTITLAALSNPTASVAYSQFATASPPVVPPSPTAPPIGYTYALTAGTLPPGLSLDTDTGEVFGTPFNHNNGTPWAFTITATGWGGCSGVQSYSLTVQCPTITLDPASLPDGIAGVPYSFFVAGKPDTPPMAPPIGYTYALIAGTLPDFLTLNTATGEISGTPDVVGDFPITIQATGWGGCSGSQAYILTIVCPDIYVYPTSLPAATDGRSYSHTLTQLGGLPPITYAVTAGALPTGMSLSSTGVLSGTPVGFGVFDFTVTATDKNGCTGSRDYHFVVNCRPVKIASQPKDAQVCPGGSVTLTVRANGSADIHYQWYRGETGDTSNPVGSDSDTYTTPALTEDTPFWVRATNPCGSDDSATALISTPGAPVFTVQPLSQTVPEGASVVLTVAVDSAWDVSYQWFKGETGDTSTPVGADADTYTVPPLHTATSYWVRATNQCGATDSDTALISVEYTRHAAHLAANEEWMSRLRVVNPHTGDNPVFIEIFNADGQLMDTLTLDSLPPGGVYDLPLDELFNKLTAEDLWLRLRSLTPVEGLVSFGTRDGEALTGLPLAAEGSTSLIYSYVYIRDDEVGSFFTGLTLVNTADDAAAATMRAFTEDGALLAEVQVPIVALGKYVRLVSEVFPGVSPELIRMVTVESDQPLLGFEIFGRWGEKGAAALPAVAAEEFGMNDQAFGGEGSPQPPLEYIFWINTIPDNDMFYTGATVANIHDDMATVLAHLYAADGTMLDEMERDIEVMQQYTREVWDFFGGAADPEAAYVRLRSLQRITGFSVMVSRDTELPFAFDGLRGGKYFSNRLAFPVVHAGPEWYAFLTVTNGMPARDNEYILTAYDLDGQIIGTYANTLAAAAQDVLDLQALFPDKAADIAWVYVEGQTRIEAPFGGFIWAKLIGSCFMMSADDQVLFSYLAKTLPEM